MTATFLRLHRHLAYSDIYTDGNITPTLRLQQHSLHSYSNSNIHSDSYSDSYVHAYTNTDSYSDSNANTHSNTNSYTDSSGCLPQ